MRGEDLNQRIAIGVLHQHRRHVAIDQNPANKVLAIGGHAERPSAHVAYLVMLVKPVLDHRAPFLIRALKLRNVGLHGEIHHLVDGAAHGGDVPIKPAPERQEGAPASR